MILILVRPTPDLFTLLHHFNVLLFNCSVAQRPSTPELREVPQVEAARSFCRGLARSIGPHYRVALYRRRPPELIEAWGGPRRARGHDPVLALLSRSPQAVINEPAEKGTRVSILSLPSSNGEPDFAVALEVDTAGLSRAARLLASMADPDGGSIPPGPEPHVGEALNRMIASAAAHVGVPVSEMSRSQKQQVVRYLDDRGAFLIKKAVEQVAGELGVSRFTIYNYLEEEPHGRR
ncbi:MAG TPA: helix-turn-helix domain-containing protein [Actinomycetota bacterium]